MKTKIMAVLVVLFSLTTQAADKVVIANSGQGWTNSNNFLPSGVPQSGDAVYVPPGVTITVKGAVYSAAAPTVNVYVSGTLDFDPSGKLALSNMSMIQLYTGGTITSSGTSSELITMGGAVKYNGANDGTVEGPKFASAATALSNGVDDAGFVFGVLPITLRAFTLSLEQREVTLNWTVSQDSKEDSYTLQRKGAADWQDMASFHPDVTGGSAQGRYSYKDRNPADGINLYRLQMRSSDGTVSYSMILSAAFHNNVPRTFLYPNPAKDRLNIQWGKVIKGGRISIKSTAGAEVYSIDITTPISAIALDVSRFIPGTYYLLIKAAGETLAQMPFIKTD